MAQHLYTFIHPTSEKHIKRACEILENDGIIAYPTEVNWALGCDPRKSKALGRIRALKPYHPKEQPFTLMCNGFAMAAEFSVIEPNAYRLLKKVLPGPYTVLFKRTRLAPKQIKDRREIVGVRIPDSPLLLDLIAAYGHPLANTSMPQHPQLQKAMHFGYEIDEVFGHAIDLILDLGEEREALETSIVDFSKDEGLEIVREGAGDVSLFKELL